MAGIDSHTLLAINFSDNAIVDVLGSAIQNPPSPLSLVSLDLLSYKYGISSAYFDGSSGVAVPYDSKFDFGTGDFTIDFWWKQPTSGNVFSGDRGIILSTTYDASTMGKLSFGVTNTVIIVGRMGVGDDTTISYTRFTDGMFHHYALVRDSGVIYLFIDGSLINTTNNTNSYNFYSNYQLLIGCQGGSNNRLVGNINGFRVSNVARWTSNFTPPSEAYYKDFFKFYLSGTDNLYGNSSGSLNLLTSTYSSLTVAQKEAILSDETNSSETILPSSVLASISPFRILETGATARQLYKLYGQLNPVVITPTDLISTSNFDSITSINVTSSVTHGNIKFAITTDLTNYYRYDFTQQDWVTCSDVAENGMSLLEINSLSSVELSALDLTGGIGFKQAFISTDTDASVSVSDISAVLSLNGVWKSAINGTDYEIRYPSKTSIEVKLLTNGDFIVNYPVTNSINSGT